MNFELSGIPSWITADPTAGTIPAGYTQIVSFNVSEQLSGGIYRDTILSLTVQGDEDLILDVRVLCAEPQWAVTPSNYQYSMNIISTLLIDSVASNDVYDMVGVFVGNETRGAGKITYIPSLDKYVVFLTIYSNVVTRSAIICVGCSKLQRTCARMNHTHFKRMPFSVLRKIL